MKTELYRTNAKSQGLVPAHFALIIIIVVHVVKHQSVINKYMQKAGEPENDAGFLKVIIRYKSKRMQQTCHNGTDLHGISCAALIPLCALHFDAIPESVQSSVSYQKAVHQFLISVAFFLNYTVIVAVHVAS